MHFEVLYGPMLMNSVTRQDTITFAHLLYIKGKSKVKKNYIILNIVLGYNFGLFQNVIFSSGAINKFDIRNPHDVMNSYPLKK